jgi:hypothetical protein
MHHPRSLVRVVTVVATLAAVALPAAAGSKPTHAEAQATVTAWIEAMELSRGAEPEPPSKAAMDLTAWPFHAAFYAEGGESEQGCGPTVTTDEASTSTALACLSVHMLTDGKMKPWSKKIAKEAGIPYIHKKDLRAYGKAATLVMVETQCAGVGSQAVFGVVKDKDGALKVSLAMGMDIFCGE